MLCSWAYLRCEGVFGTAHCLQSRTKKMQILPKNDKIAGKNYAGGSLLWSPAGAEDDGGSDGSLIQTIPGRGYRFAASIAPSEHVTRVESATPAAKDATDATGRRAPCRADEISPFEPVADPRRARILPAVSRR